MERGSKEERGRRAREAEEMGYATMPTFNYKAIGSMREESIKRRHDDMSGSRCSFLWPRPSAHQAVLSVGQLSSLHAHLDGRCSTSTVCFLHDHRRRATPRPTATVSFTCFGAGWCRQNAGPTGKSKVGRNPQDGAGTHHQPVLEKPVWPKAPRGDSGKEIRLEWFFHLEVMGFGAREATGLNDTRREGDGDSGLVSAWIASSFSSHSHWRLVSNRADELAEELCGRALPDCRQPLIKYLTSSAGLPVEGAWELRLPHASTYTFLSGL